jgi:hypothetical protein
MQLAKYFVAVHENLLAYRKCRDGLKLFMFLLSPYSLINLQKYA